MPKSTQDYLKMRRLLIMVINKTQPKRHFINIRCKSGIYRLGIVFFLPHFLQAIVPMPLEGKEIQMLLKYLPYDE
jgi:hypothetical protein